MSKIQYIKLTMAFFIVIEIAMIYLYFINEASLFQLIIQSLIFVLMILLLTQKRKTP
jgi:hypothetical protein